MFCGKYFRDTVWNGDHAIPEHCIATESTQGCLKQILQPGWRGGN